MSYPIITATATLDRTTVGILVAEFEIRIGTLCTFRDGKVISAEGFPERERALEAAGLSESE